MSSTPSDDAPAGGDAPASAPAASDRRRNLALRALIDEMLFQVRGMQRDHPDWGADERAQAEAELARIMTRVRDAAAPGRTANPSS